MTERPTSKEHGAALLSIILIVASMSVAALIAVEAVSRSVQLAKTSTGRAQAFWHVASAEALGASVIRQIVEQTDGQIVYGEVGYDEQRVFPLGSAEMRVRLMDATNCFNLNALAETTADTPRRVAFGRGQDDDEEGTNEGEEADSVSNDDRFITLLERQGMFAGDARALLQALKDWMDTDSTPLTYGAESGYYSLLETPYRAADTLLNSVSELHVILGFGPEVMEIAGDNLCARPEYDQSVLNLNTLRPDQAPLLAAMYSSALSETDAQSVLRQRPTGGWANIVEFEELPQIKKIAPDARSEDAVGLRSQYFELSGVILAESAEFHFQALFSALPDQDVRLIWRRMGEP